MARKGRVDRGLVHLIVVLPMLSVSAQAAVADIEKPKEQYLCIAEHATGFEYDKHAKQWDSATFHANRKYVIAPSKDEKSACQITEVGDSSPRGWCRQTFDEYGYLECVMVFGTLRYNKTNGRFMRVSPVGYVEIGPDWFFKSDEKTDTPFIEIGKCSSF